MRNYEELTQMTERERRWHRRRLRRQRIFRRRIAAVLFTVCLVAVCVVSYGSIRSRANEEQRNSFKYYTRISVGNGDTLWDIAEQYMDAQHYKNKNDYIAEVIQINHLDEEAGICAGQYITVPYYSYVFVN